MRPNSQHARALLACLSKWHRRQPLYRHYVSTVSRLASAFDAKPTNKLNFTFNTKNVGLFGIPELTDHTGFYLLKENATNEVANLVQEATGPNRQRKMVKIFDELSDCICKVADMSDFIRSSHPQRFYLEAAEDTWSSLSGLVEKLNVNVELYKALKDVVEKGDIVETDDVDKRVAVSFLKDFEQSGIHLDENKRLRFVELKENVLRLGAFFMQGSCAPAVVPKTLIPDHLKYCFNTHGENVVVNGMYSDNHNDFVREAAYKIYLYPDQHQEDLLVALLNARQQLAKLVGCSSYAHYRLDGTLLETPEHVRDFLETLSDKLRPKASKDFETIRQMKLQSTCHNKDVMPWDPTYYGAIAKHEMCKMDSTELAPYFSLGNCMEGLNMVLESIFGVTLKHELAENGEVWNTDIHKLAVEHETEGLLGYIYCDFFERIGKDDRDCHHMIRGGRLLEDGSYQLPIVALKLHFSPPHSSVPSLLSPMQVSTLFHEFGHAMHSMLGRTKYQHVTGIRCPLDFAEVPSSLMEHFLKDIRVLSKFVKHYKTGEVLSYRALKTFVKSQDLFAASELQLQVSYAMLDQVLHSEMLQKSTTEVMAEVQNKYYGIPHVSQTAWQLKFSHLVHYSARYCSYIIARAVAARIWQECFSDDPFSRANGEKYRQEVLAHGGGKPPAELLSGLLNKQFTNQLLVESIMDDLEDR